MYPAVVAQCEVAFHSNANLRFSHLLCPAYAFCPLLQPNSPSETAVCLFVCFKAPDKFFSGLMIQQSINLWVGTMELTVGSTPGQSGDEKWACRPSTTAKFSSHTLRTHPFIKFCSIKSTICVHFYMQYLAWGKCSYSDWNYHNYSCVSSWMCSVKHLADQCTHPSHVLFAEVSAPSWRFLWGKRSHAKA